PPDLREHAARVRARRLPPSTAARGARRRIEALGGPAFDALCDAVLKGELDIETATARALDEDRATGR
ncbi:MAG: hypothetical protein IIA41_14710, partial [SAR324 cluster bacterium]|nr:hypothetical protein [SAR324 cluster bacterium]